MSLKEMYRLRNNFIILGLTGRMGGGCNEIINLLTSKKNPFGSLPNYDHLHINERRKFDICKNLLSHPKNIWVPFKVIPYRNVLLLYFIDELRRKAGAQFEELSACNLKMLFAQLYDPDRVETPRIGQDKCIISEQILQVLKNNRNNLINIAQTLDVTKLRNYKRHGEDDIDETKVNKLFFESYAEFCEEFYATIDRVNPLTRRLFLQDIACNLRRYGQITFNPSSPNNDDSFIYLISELINRLIKINKYVEQGTRVAIVSMKNSLEINYFRERYAGFYLVSANRDKGDVDRYLLENLKKLKLPETSQCEILAKLKEFDKIEYRITQFKNGIFTSPDVENCIQKADYYIYINKHDKGLSKEDLLQYSYKLQLMKLLALIMKPGIVTPNALERNMQLAFSSKYNSGCISRQVGAVITDGNFSVKSIGWNEVPQGQTPCTLRDLRDLIFDGDNKVYSEYERENGNYNGKTFKELAKEAVPLETRNKKGLDDILKGHNCPFCFKEFHNAFEGKDNQVHTRSLHAEENAMLQISKYGGQPVKEGILFTTASPCELCSKKAFQLGIQRIFFIDPYPGIAKEHILKSGSHIKKSPQLIMYHGAVGRGYFKLYEPYMSIKDETKIRTGIKPVKSERTILKELESSLSEELKDAPELTQLVKKIFSHDAQSLKHWAQVVREELSEFARHPRTPGD